MGTAASLPPSAQPSRFRTVRRAQDPSPRGPCPSAVRSWAGLSPLQALHPSSRLHREEEGGKEEEEEKEEECKWGEGGRRKKRRKKKILFLMTCSKN